MNFPVLEPDHFATQPFQMPCSHCIVRFTPKVTAAIQLDHQQVFLTEEVSVKRREGMLPSEFGSELPVANVLPEDLFCWGAVFSEASGPLDVEKRHMYFLWDGNTNPHLDVA